MNLPKVRTARPEDFDGIMRMCVMLHEENGISAVDWNTVAECVINGINGHRSTLAVIGPSEDLHGMLLLRFASSWYSNDAILEELYNYVPEKHRSSHNARALIEFAKAAADKLEMPLLIGILSNHRTRAKVRLYERVFGEPAGAFFLYGQRTGGLHDVRRQDENQLEKHLHADR